jgi:hypothetical protein
MNTKPRTHLTSEGFAFAAFGICLLASLLLFVYQVASYTTLL